MRNICAIKMCNTKMLDKKMTVSHNITRNQKTKKRITKGT